MSEFISYMTLKEISISIDDGDWIESKDQSKSGIRLIQTGNIGNGIYIDHPEDAKYITGETFKERKCKEVFPGDILISRLPRPVGRGCILPDTIGRAITAVDCTIVKLNTDICYPEYLIYFLQSEQYYDQMHLTGTTRERITRKKLEDIIIPIPSIKIQKKIVSNLDETFIKLKQIENNITKLLTIETELRKSLLCKEFGEIPSQNK